MFKKRNCLILMTFLTGSLLLSSCSNPSGKSQISNLSETAANSSVDRIKSDLKRSAFIIFTARVEAYPMTGALLKTTLQEEGRKRGLSPDQIISLNDEMNGYQRDRSCFNVAISSGNPEAINLGYWGVKIIQKGKVSQTQFIDIYKPGFSLTNTTVYATTYQSTNTTYLNSVDSTMYYNSGTVCTAQDNKIDYLQGFEMKLVARFLKTPKEATLTWQDPR